MNKQFDVLLVFMFDRLALRTKGPAMLSGNIFCAHCDGRITTTHHKDHYFRKDGAEYLKDELKYRCYHKANKLCECEGQTNYSAAKVDETVMPIYKRFKSWAEEFDNADLEQKEMIACQLFDRIELGKNYTITIHMNVTYKQLCPEWDEPDYTCAVS